MSRIFLVEDDEYLSRVYERAFRLAGHEYTQAQDGEEALQMLRALEIQPDVIVMDIAMPKMDGAELLKNIRADSQLKSVPVAVLTNSFHMQDKDAFMELGASLFLVKIDNQPSEVVTKVESLVHSGEVEQDSV